MAAHQAGVRLRGRQLLHTALFSSLLSVGAVEETVSALRRAGEVRERFC